MRDFLTNLTARTLEATPLLQPRPLARFEPSPLVTPRAVLDVPSGKDELARQGNEFGLEAEAAEEIAPSPSTRPNRRPRRSTLPTDLATKPFEDDLIGRLNYMAQIEPPRPAMVPTLNQPTPSPSHKAQPAQHLAANTEAMFNPVIKKGENRQPINQLDIKQSVAPSVQPENESTFAPNTLHESAQARPLIAKPQTKVAFAPQPPFVTPNIAPIMQPSVVEDFPQMQTRVQTQATRTEPKSIVERFAERLAADAVIESQPQRPKDPKYARDEPGTISYEPHGVRVEPKVTSHEPAISHEPIAAPTINVTIGRIEVRATPPLANQPTRAASSRQSGMSLDEYLQQRNNRQRGGEFR